MPANVWIVLVNFNGLDDTRKCLRSLDGQSHPASVVVVDNASTVDPLATLQTEFAWANVVQAGVNGGWAGGNNVGLRYALDRGADWVVLLNNDTTVSPDLVARLMAAVATRPDVGIIGPVIRFMAPPSEVQTEGVVFNRPDRPGFLQRHAVPLRTDDPPHVVEVDIVNGCCLAVSRTVVERIGLVDEAFFLVHEESDFCLRAQRAGFTIGVLAEALVWHKGSSSFQREGKKLQRYFDSRNLIRLLVRHRDRPNGRHLIRGFGHYLRHMYHRYSIEREAGFPVSAEGVVEGLYDGLIGRYGPRSDRPRPGLGILRAMFATGWRAKGGRRARA